MSIYLVVCSLGLLLWLGRCSHVIMSSSGYDCMLGVAVKKPLIWLEVLALCDLLSLCAGI